MTKEQAIQLLRDKGLRSTAPRIAVLLVLSKAKRPLSHTEMLERLGETDWDPATVYRNLVKLRDAGLAPIAHRTDGLTVTHSPEIMGMTTNTLILCAMIVV